MLKYIVILLDDRSVAYCHCNNPKTERRLISIDTLKEAILFAMKENLNIQFVWSDYELPEIYKKLICSIDHVNIVSASLTEDADVVVYDSIPDSAKNGATVVARCRLHDFFVDFSGFKPVLQKAARVNVVFTDADMFSDDDIARYQNALNSLAETVKEEYISGHSVQFNLLTDRIMLDAMNNCNAGWESVTLAPDGKFYICPAFYYSGYESAGSFPEGINVKNPQLYRLDYAPICRHCDAWQCRRCVWLNRNLTLEVNTPSRQQCVMAHIEREVSRKLLADIRKVGEFMPEKRIPEIDYNDPFEKISK